MYSDRVLPFVEKSVVLDISDRIVDYSEIYFPFEVNSVATDHIDAVAESVLKSSENRFLKVDPLGVILFCGEIDLVAWIIKNKVALRGQVTRVDYSWIADRIRLDEVGKAYFPSNGAFECQDIQTGDLISAAVEYRSLSNTELAETFSSEGLLVEGAFSDDWGDESPDNDVVVDNRRKLSYLDDYFAAADTMDMLVPMLRGNTAVAKSSIVEDMCKKKGYRLVDYRLAFTTSLDFMGLTDFVSVDNGGRRESFSANSPVHKIISCSDEYMDFLTECVEKINVELKRNDLPPDTRKKLDDSVKYLSEMLKPPVIFFDEITQAKSDVRNAILRFLMADMLRRNEADLYKTLDKKEEKDKEEKLEYARLKGIRSIAKNGNYA